MTYIDNYHIFHFQAEGLEKVYNIFTSESAETSVRKSAAEQLAIVLQGRSTLFQHFSPLTVLLHSTTSTYPLYPLFCFRPTSTRLFPESGRVEPSSAETSFCHQKVSS